MARKKEEIKNEKNAIVMKVLVVLGVVVFSFTIIYLVYHFFFKNSNLGTNYSTDKKTEYINLEGQEEIMASQKFISDLDYSMRYDVERFVVSKYNNQDFYRFKDNDRVFIVVEKGIIPETCGESLLDTTYNNCFVKMNDTTEEYYITKNDKTYKITLKSPNTTEFQEGVKRRIHYMLNTFEIA